jgi:transposase-like protein
MFENRKKEQKVYPLVFIMEVITEVQNGRISITRAQRKYGIGGHATIQKWINKYGKLGGKKTQELDKMSKLELEMDKLKKEKQELESALAKAHLKMLTMESLIEIYEEEKVKKTEKKSTDKKLSNEALRKAIGMQENTQ